MWHHSLDCINLLDLLEGVFLLLLAGLTVQHQALLQQDLSCARDISAS